MIVYQRPRMSLRGFYGRDICSRGPLAGFGDGIDPSDVQAVNRALQLMDAALAEAQAIRDQNAGVWGTVKGAVTGVDVDTIKAEVATFEKAATSMHDTATKLLADPNTSHARVVDFVRGVSEIANISSLKDSANRNDLAKMAADVASQTAQQIAPKVESTMKWLVVGAVAVGLAIYAPEVKALFGLGRKKA